MTLFLLAIMNRLYSVMAGMETVVLGASTANRNMVVKRALAALQDLPLISKIIICVLLILLTQLKIGGLPTSKNSYSDIEICKEIDILSKFKFLYVFSYNLGEK